MSKLKKTFDCFVNFFKIFMAFVFKFQKSTENRLNFMLNVKNLELFIVKLKHSP